MTSSIFPDVNVWVAMAFTGHAHHRAAKKWLYSIPQGDRLIFCRFTQLGFLRLITNSQVMGNSVRTLGQAWKTYDAFLLDGNARMMQEPSSLEQYFRRLSNFDSTSPKYWADAYLSAFAEAAGLQLVTFDKALASRVEDSVLIRPNS